MNGYEKRTLGKREAILEAARTLFARKGVTETSVTEIAAGARVSRVTLFKYFGSKEALAREAMLSWIDLLTSEYEGILSGEMPFREKLVALLSARFAGRERIGERFICATAWEDEELQRLIGELAVARAYPVATELIREGKRTGDIDPSLSDEAIFAYLSAFGPVVRNPEYARKGKAFQADLFNLFLGGLVTNWRTPRDGD